VGARTNRLSPAGRLETQHLRAQAESTNHSSYNVLPAAALHLGYRHGYLTATFLLRPAALQRYLPDSSPGTARLQTTAYSPARKRVAISLWMTQNRGRQKLGGPGNPTRPPATELILHLDGD
jgi:hypothetical protein